MNPLPVPITLKVLPKSLILKAAEYLPEAHTLWDWRWDRNVGVESYSGVVHLSHADMCGVEWHFISGFRPHEPAAKSCLPCRQLAQVHIMHSFPAGCVPKPNLRLVVREKPPPFHVALADVWPQTLFRRQNRPWASHCSHAIPHRAKSARLGVSSGNVYVETSFPELSVTHGSIVRPSQETPSDR